jgi:putative ABC transport system permease protein
MKMGFTNNSNAYLIEGNDKEQSPIFSTNWVDFDYLETYGMGLSEGRFISGEITADSNSAVINEAALRAYNITDPLNTRLIQPGLSPEERVIYRVVGVVKDFHYESFHDEILPYIFIPKPLELDWGGYLTVKLETADLRSTIAEIEELWKEFSNMQPFEYDFIDREFEQIYEEELRTGKIFAVFSILAILVACLGLLGLSSYSAEQRTKEIGIRKSMGADIPGIVRLLSRETVLLVLVATAISVPLAWYFMKNWLEAFAYRISIGPGVFLLAFLGALLIALVTVSFQAVNAAMKNPADSLRYE